MVIQYLLPVTENCHLEIRDRKRITSTNRAPDKSVWLKINFLISYPKHVLLVLKRKSDHQSHSLLIASILYIIRIYHQCEGKIEKSVLRIAVWHHEACRVMTNGNPEGQIFLPYPHMNNGFFFLLTTVFICFKISFQKSHNKLRCNFTWWRYLICWVR